MEKMEQIVERAANGDRNAFEELYRNTYKKVYFTCMAFLKNDQNAADVSQDIYITVIKGLPGLKDKSKFESWLGVITVNKCKDFLKKSKPILVEEEALAEQIPEENELLLPEAYVTTKAKREILMDLIRENLSDTLYQTVIMFYFQNMSAAEIAELMDCPVGTITSRLCLARAKIKDAILKYEKKNGDKLHSVALVPILALLFKEEAIACEPPYMCERIMKVASTEAATAQVATNAGGKIMLKSLKAKIIVGLAAAAVVGGIAAVVAGIGDQENNSPVDAYENVDDGDDTEDMVDSDEYSEEEPETYDDSQEPSSEEEYVDDYEVQQAEYRAIAEDMLAQVEAFFQALTTGDTATLKKLAYEGESCEYYEEFVELCELECTSQLFATIYKDVKYCINEDTLEELVYDLEGAYEDGDETIMVTMSYSKPELLIMSDMYTTCFAEGTEVSDSVTDEAKAYEMLEDALQVTPMVAGFNLWVTMPDENGKIKVDIDEFMENLRYNYWSFSIDEQLVQSYVSSEINPSGKYYDGTFTVGRDASVPYRDNHEFLMETDKYLSEKDFAGFGNYLSTVSGEDYVTKYNNSWGRYDELSDTQKQFVDSFVEEKMDYQFVEYTAGGLARGMLIIKMPLLNDGENHEIMLTDWYEENNVMETFISYPSYPSYSGFSDLLFAYYRVIDYARKYVE